MARTIYVSGNDGSGKTTFLNRYEARLNSSGLKTSRRHYYDSLMRTIIRSSVEKVFSVTQKKSTERNHNWEDLPITGNTRKKSPVTVGLKRVSINAFLWFYQSLMGLEARLRDIACTRKVIVTDRCYIDDLASIYEILNIPVSTALVKWSTWLFPARKIYYLSAGSKQEYARIVDVDLSPETHRRKHERYVRLVEIVESTTEPIRRVMTGSPQENNDGDPS